AHRVQDQSREDPHRRRQEGGARRSGTGSSRRTGRRGGRGGDGSRVRRGRGRRSCRRGNRRRGRGRVRVRGELSVPKGEIVERVVKYVVKEIVDNPDAVDVTIIEQGPDEVLAEVRTAKGDMGRVIGRRGRVARAIRTVASAAADEEGVTAQVEFVD